MDKDLAIGDLRVRTTEFDSSIQPSFTRTPKGWLMSSYNASYKSQKPEEDTLLNIAMQYQEINGLQMLRTLDLRGTYGGNPFGVELTFSDCQVTKH